jgi:hypothetical protein
MTLWYVILLDRINLDKIGRFSVAGLIKVHRVVVGRDSIVFVFEVILNWITTAF